MNSASSFLQELLAGVDDGYLTLVRLTSGAISDRLAFSKFDPVWVEEYVAKHKDTLYYNVGICRDDLGSKVRGSKESVSAITCLWADIDLPKEGSKKNYPPMDVIEAALADMPLKYTALVHTGGGVHAYWFFNEPYTITGLQDAENVESTLTRPWAQLLRSKLGKHGPYDVDSVQDVSRMLRIPYSWHKNGNQCYVVRSDASLRYGVEDFKQFLEGVELEALLPKHVPQITRAIDGTIKLDKLEALLLNSPSFREVWNRKKVHPSASETDASLARHALTGGWSDDEIANLMFAFDKKHGLGRDGKLLRKDGEYGTYIGRVIAFVRKQGARDTALASFGDALSEDGFDASQLGDTEPEDQGTNPETGTPVKPSRQSNEEVLKCLTSALELPVARWIQVGRENPVYTLVLANGHQIKVGGEAAVLDNSQVFAVLEGSVG
jgi:hypothetical protein